MDSIKGYIHSIETFSTLDGPGIRSVVFFQGCPLRCLYCHNPDTRKCSASSHIVSIKELTSEVLKYKSYYEASNGGITVSGGEPCYQPDFLAEFLKELRKLNIHTAIDTSGYVDEASSEKFLPYTKLVLLDIKHLKSKECIKLTGKSNEKAFSFLKLLNSRNIPVILRQVLLKDFTDTDDYIKELILFAKSYSCIKKIEVLPFHKMGEPKWEALGLNPPLKKIPSYNIEKSEAIQKRINEAF